MGLTKQPASLVHGHLFPKELQAETCVGQGREESRGQTKYETEGTGSAHSWADEIAVCLVSVLLQFLYCWWQRWLQSALSTQRQNAGFVSHQIPGTPSGITGHSSPAAVQRLAIAAGQEPKVEPGAQPLGFPPLHSEQPHWGCQKLTRC